MIRQSSSKTPTFINPGRWVSGRRSATASPEIGDEIEMLPIQPRKSRAAISGQTGLHPLRLGSQNTVVATSTDAGVSSTPPRPARAASSSVVLNDSTPPGRARNPTNAAVGTPRRGNGLSDAEFIAAEPAWSTSPHGSHSPVDSYTYTAQHARRAFSLARPTNFGITHTCTDPGSCAFGITQADGSTAQIIQNGAAGLLLDREEGRNLRARQKRKQLSRPYFWASAVTPVSAVAFGLGAFDWVAVEKSEGEVREMDPDDKMQALMLLAPLSLMLWIIFVVVVFLAVEGAKGNL